MKSVIATVLAAAFIAPLVARSWSPAMALGAAAPRKANAPTLRTAPRTEILNLASRLGHGNNWTVSWTAVREAAKLVMAQPSGTNMAAFKPLVEPLFGWAYQGGIGRGYGMLAAGTLVRIGQPAVPVLQAKLKSKHSHDRWSALNLLGRIGKPKAPLLAAARGLLHDPDSYVRRTAIQVLGRMGRYALPAVKELKRQDARERKLLRAQNMSDEYDLHAVFVQLALIRIQGADKARIAALAQYLKVKDADGYAASYAADVLAQLGPAARWAEPQLLWAMRHGSGQERTNVAWAFGLIRVHDPSVVEALIHCLKHDPVLYARESAAASLGEIGPRARAALPWLRAARKKKPWWGWQDAIKMIERK